MYLSCVKRSMCVDILAQTPVCIGNSVRGGVPGEGCVCLGRTGRKTKTLDYSFGPCSCKFRTRGGNRLIPDGSELGRNVSFFGVTDGRGSIAALQFL